MPIVLILGYVAPAAMPTVLILGLVVLACGVAVLLARRAGWRWRMGTLGGVAFAVAVIVALLLYVHMRVSYQGKRRVAAVREALGPQASGPVEEKLVHTGGVGIMDDAPSGFLADVYPSPEQAAKALAADLGGSVASVADGDARPASVHVTGQAQPSLLETIADVLRPYTSSGRVEVVAAATAPATRPAAEVTALCKVFGSSEQEGTIQMVLSGPSGEVSRSTRFRTTAWAADFAGYVAGADHPWILARSSGLSPSFAQAEGSALAEAAGQLMPHVQAAMERAVARRLVRRDAAAGPDELGPLVLAELRRGRFISGRFPQRFSRPYADLWRQVLLVDASPRTVDAAAVEMARQVSGRREAERTGWARIALSIGGTAVLIFLVYLLLNAATKGYYAWALRAAAIVLVAIAAIVALMA